MIDFTDVISCEFQDACASDLAVVNAARVSFDTQHSELEPGDEKLISFLMRNRHTTPFEHGYFKFLVEAPIFVFREHHRHRIGHSYNEVSGRYTKLEPKFYVPVCARVQTGKPGSYVYVEHGPNTEVSSVMNILMMDSYKQSWDIYERLLRAGIAKEQARMVLPVGVYTKMIWSCNPKSLMHFLGLRLAKEAQAEIRVVAGAAELAFKQCMPITWQAFVDNGKVAP